MRFREFVIENYNRDTTLRKWHDRIWYAMFDDSRWGPGTQAEYKHEETRSDLKWFYDETRATGGKFPGTPGQKAAIDSYVKQTLDSIERADPSPDKRYVPFMLRMWAGNRLNPNQTVNHFEDLLSTVGDTIRKHYEMSQRKRPAQPGERQQPWVSANINRIMDIEQLDQFTDMVDNAWDEYSSQEENLPKGESKTLYNGADYAIITPLDQEAACYLGRRTKWCTAATKATNYFDHYNNLGPLYIVIPKKPAYKGEKYQLHGESVQVMNEKDKPVRLVDLVKRFPSIRQVLSNVSSTENGTSDFDNWVEMMDPKFVNQGIKTYTDWFKEDFMDWYPNALALRIRERLPKPNSADFVKQFAADIDPDETHNKIGQLFKSLIPHIKLYYADLQQYSKTLNMEKAATGAERDFPLYLASAFQDRLIGDISKELDNTRALSIEERSIMNQLLAAGFKKRYLSGKLKAEWDDKGWEFDIEE